jgi:hypothetical protein
MRKQALQTEIDFLNKMTEAAGTKIQNVLAVSYKNFSLLIEIAI